MKIVKIGYILYSGTKTVLVDRVAECIAQESEERRV
jgi:hypothetical protein